MVSSSNTHFIGFLIHPRKILNILLLDSRTIRSQLSKQLRRASDALGLYHCSMYAPTSATRESPYLICLSYWLSENAMYCGDHIYLDMRFNRGTDLHGGFGNNIDGSMAVETREWLRLASLTDPFWELSLSVLKGLSVRQAHCTLAKVQM